MTLYQHKYHIETTRMQGWDYASDGYYFVTICVKDREHLFGHLANGQMVLNEFGQTVNQCWFDLPNHYGNIRLDAFCVMPNHIHGIIVIDNNTTNIVETGLKPVSKIDPTNHALLETGLKPVSTKQHGLFEMVRALKTFSARRINEIRHSAGMAVWQPRFHDHVIRDEKSLQNIREYIIRNPEMWEKDRF